MNGGRNRERTQGATWMRLSRIFTLQTLGFLMPLFSHSLILFEANAAHRPFDTAQDPAERFMLETGMRPDGVVRTLLRGTGLPTRGLGFQNMQSSVM